MKDLTEFLLARIAEDEEIAIHAQAHWEGPPEHWEVGRQGMLHDTLRRVGDHLTTTAAEIGSVVRGVDHIARWDPARVLAECEAKRRIVERITQPGEMLIMSSYPILRSLALPYADHPDYREEWRP